jgi:hypothetical protein
MSAVYGYDSSYSAIQDTHQDLNLGGAGFNQEFEFLTGFSADPMSERPMRLWKDWYDYIFFNQAKPTLREATSAMDRMVATQAAGLSTNSTSNNQAMTIYEAISADPHLSKFKDLIDQMGYGKIFEQGITIFAPINDQFDEILHYALKVAFRPVAALQSLRYHVLPYIIKPWQLQDRVLRLRTDLNNQPVESDWTRGKRVLLNKINPGYIPPIAGSFTNGSPGADPYPARSDCWFPKLTDEVPILGVKECSNGYLYIINRPICFSDLL